MSYPDSVSIEKVKQLWRRIQVLVLKRKRIYVLVFSFGQEHISLNKKITYLSGTNVYMVL